MWSKTKQLQQFPQPKEWKFKPTREEQVSKSTTFMFGTAKLQGKQESVRTAKEGKTEEDQYTRYKQNTKGYQLNKKVRRRQKRTVSQYNLRRMEIKAVLV